MSLYVLATHGNQIAPELETMLGEMVEQNESLKAAIEQLSQVDRTDEKNFNQRLGNVIEQLGNSMAHGANATVVVQALVKIIQMSGLG